MSGLSLIQILDSEKQTQEMLVFWNEEVLQIFLFYRA